MKIYYIQMNIGNAKYVASYHDGKKLHADGSPFYDVALFSNKEKLNTFKLKLDQQGYKEI